MMQVGKLRPGGCISPAGARRERASAIQIGIVWDGLILEYDPWGMRFFQVHGVLYVHEVLVLQQLCKTVVNRAYCPNAAGPFDMLVMVSEAAKVRRVFSLPDRRKQLLTVGQRHSSVQPGLFADKGRKRADGCTTCPKIRSFEETAK